MTPGTGSGCPCAEPLRAVTAALWMLACKAQTTTTRRAAKALAGSFERRLAEGAGKGHRAEECPVCMLICRG